MMQIKITRQVVLKELRDMLLLAIVGFSTTVLYHYLQDFSTRIFLIVGSLMACMWILLWKGNAYLAELLGMGDKWLTHPLRTFFIGIISTLVYSAGSVYLLVSAFEWVFSVNFGGISGILYSAVMVTIVITLFMHGRSFLLSWKEAALDAERLKHEQVTARYESLKSQVNPHFLFNSLNALTNLVYENQELAVNFIKQLSEVYRYVLDTRDRELVGKEEELRFLDSYLFLQRIRFGNNLIVNVDLKNIVTSFPPLVLQMLIENAIKHNEISKEYPLTIQVFSEDDYVVIQNTLRKKKVLPKDSPGIGLSNITSRYEFLSDKKVLIQPSDETFEVRLPILSNVV